MTAVHVDVAAYAIGSLDRDDADDFVDHLETCPTCPAELEWLSRIVNLMTSTMYVYSEAS
jgi:anti-sigma factor RsiW